MSLLPVGEARRGSLHLVVGVPLEEIIELRHAVLREGKPKESAKMAGDESSETVHCGLWLTSADCSPGTKKLIACATLMKESLVDARAALGLDSEASWANWKVRLRGMAVDFEAQGKGHGSQFLGFIQALAQKEGLSLWCEAREQSVSFYERGGFEIVGEPFDVPKIGPHRWMLASSS